MFGLTELLIIAVVITLVVGPRKLFGAADQLRSGFRRMQSSVSGQPAEEDPPATTHVTGSTAATAAVSASGKPRAGFNVWRLWDLTNLIGFLFVAAGLAVIIGDLNWWHIGSPALALGLVLLAAGTFCLAW